MAVTLRHFNDFNDQNQAVVIEMLVSSCWGVWIWCLCTTFMASPWTSWQVLCLGHLWFALQDTKGQRNRQNGWPRGLPTGILQCQRCIKALWRPEMKFVKSSKSSIVEFFKDEFDLWFDRMLRLVCLQATSHPPMLVWDLFGTALQRWFRSWLTRWNSSSSAWSCPLMPCPKASRKIYVRLFGGKGPIVGGANCVFKS